MAERLERIQCADPSEYPTRHLLRVEGCGLIQRAYIETAMNGSIGSSFGTTRAAVIVPIPLTASSSSATKLIGLTCLNHSSSTRSESRTTIGQRSSSRG